MKSMKITTLCALLLCPALSAAQPEQVQELSQQQMDEINYVLMLFCEALVRSNPEAFNNKTDEEIDMMIGNYLNSTEGQNAFIDFVTELNAQADRMEKAATRTPKKLQSTGWSFMTKTSLGCAVTAAIAAGAYYWYTSK